jgi:tripeptidyl-peptidase-1
MACSPSGRAYPDVAAQGLGFQVVVGGSVISVGGTSASSPVCHLASCAHLLTDSFDVTQTFAGVISLINDFRLAKGKASLGFLNPIIYAHPTGFNDIISGSNPGCSTTGFTARAGWDPVSVSFRRASLGQLSVRVFPDFCNR